MSDARIGVWMRNKETGEVVKIIKVGLSMVEYRNDDVDGEVATSLLEKHFDLLSDPVSREDIEAILIAAHDFGDMDTGLYDVGVSFVVFDIVEGKPVFTWFDRAAKFAEVLSDVAFQQ